MIAVERSGTPLRRRRSRRAPRKSGLKGPLGRVRMMMVDSTRRKTLHDFISTVCAGCSAHIRAASSVSTSTITWTSSPSASTVAAPRIRLLFYGLISQAVKTRPITYDTIVWSRAGLRKPPEATVEDTADADEARDFLLADDEAIPF